MEKQGETRRKQTHFDDLLLSARLILHKLKHECRNLFVRFPQQKII